MEEEKLYGCSIAPRIINKNELNDQDAFKNGFTAWNISLNNLKEFIKKGGAFSYAFKNDVRSSSNFLGTEILAADIDEGMTIQQALELPFVKNHASFLYTTTSHTQDKHRFRIVFTFEGGITKADDLRQIVTAISARLSGDMSVTDCARIFYGSRDCEIYDIGNELTQEVIDDLLVQGKEIIATDKSSINYKATASRSSRHITDDLMVRLKNGQSISITSVHKNTTIFCPDHNDTHPSAFVGFSEKGRRFIYCHACQSTRWLKGDDTRYDFDDFDKVVKEVASMGDYETSLVKGFAFYYEQKRKVGGRIHLSSQEKFSLPALEEGVSFVKSPKGSGKTTMLPEIFKDLAFITKGGSLTLKEIEENEDPDCEPLYQFSETSFSIILIGHRQALIRELCRRLGLNCYLDDYERRSSSSENKTSFFSRSLGVQGRQKRYGVCLDSLPIVSRNRYDLIIIDECEQVLSHFLSQTMSERRYDVFSLFGQFLKNAKHIICLDADLSWISFNTICELADTDSFDECIKKGLGKDNKINSKEYRSRPVYIHLNEFKKNDEEIKIYSSENHLTADLDGDVSTGKKIFVTSNSMSLPLNHESLNGYD